MRRPAAALLTLVILAPLAAGCGDDGPGEPLGVEAGIERYVRLVQRFRIDDPRPVDEIEAGFRAVYDDQPFDCDKPANYWTVVARTEDGDGWLRAVAAEVAFCPDGLGLLVDRIDEGIPQLGRDAIEFEVDRLADNAIP